MTVKLLIIQGRPEGKSLLFPNGEYLIGRGAECHVRPNSDWVSRQHCLLRVTPQVSFLRDLGSRNGTLVNGVRILQELALGDGDQVQIGPLVFQVVSEANENTTSPIEHPAEEMFARPHGISETIVRDMDTAEIDTLAVPGRRSEGTRTKPSHIPGSPAAETT